MRFKWERGGWGIKVYPWHSVNLVPHVVSLDMGSDDEPWRTVSRCLWMTILGTVVVLARPSSKTRLGRELVRARGLAWSRRSCRWYRIRA